MNNKDNVIDKDKLTGAAANLDSVLYLMQDIEEGYFGKFNPDSDEDKFSILWEFNKYRAFTNSVCKLLFSIEKVFKKNGIAPYFD